MHPSKEPSMSTPDRQRIFWLDAAKAYGMFLVYYGHIVERFYNGENQAALLQDRLIYAFHMPLFFFISGFFARDTPDTPRAFVRKGLCTRILPVLFFSLLMIPGMAVEHAQPPNPSYYSAEFINSPPYQIGTIEFPINPPLRIKSEQLNFLSTTRLHGFYPIAGANVLHLQKKNDMQFIEISKHREALPGLYNEYGARHRSEDLGGIHFQNV